MIIRVVTGILGRGTTQGIQDSAQLLVVEVVLMAVIRFISRFQGLKVLKSGHIWWESDRF